MIEAWKREIIRLFVSLFFICIVMGGIFLLMFGPVYIILGPGLIYEYFWGVSAVGAWISIGVFWGSFCAFPFIYSWLRSPSSSPTP